MNAQYLRRRFVARLARSGGTVLDVGCGTGSVLEILRDSGFRDIGLDATGVEHDPTAAEQARAKGFTVHDARAERLPFEDGSFDHVTMRHVPHHLEDVPTGISEALRVARQCVVIAEPWFDESFACQALALEFDRWLKGHHRRLGRIHGENLSAQQLLGMVAGRDAFDIEIEHCLRLRPRPFAEFRAEAIAATSDLDDPNELQRRDELLTRIADQGASFGGSVIVHLTRKA